MLLFLFDVLSAYAITSIMTLCIVETSVLTFDIVRARISISIRADTMVCLLGELQGVFSGTTVIFVGRLEW